MRRQQANIIAKTIGIVIALGLVLIAAGCTQPTGATEAPVATGVVTFDGEPYADLVVTVEDSVTEPTISKPGITDSTGTYEVELTQFIDAGITEVYIGFDPTSGFKRERFLRDGVAAGRDLSFHYQLKRLMAITLPASGTSDVPTTTTVSWEGTPESDRYELRIWPETSPGTFTLDETLDAGSATSHTPPLGTFVANTKYLIDVRGFNANGTPVADTSFHTFTTAQ
jgi:hypothetical protein